jgi:site-specific DNA recombinase
MYVYHEGQNQNYVCKTCKNRITVADIDEIFHAQLKTFLLTETDVQTHVAKSDAAIAEKETMLKNMQAEVTKIKKRMDNLVQMRLDNDLSRESFIGQHKPLEERVSQINDQIPQIEAEIDFLKIQYLSSDTILREAKDLYERWPTIPFEEKRGIVEIITEKITIGKEDIAIKLSYLPSAFPESAEKGNTSLSLRWPFGICRCISKEPLLLSKLTKTALWGYISNNIGINLGFPNVRLVYSSGWMMRR